MPHAVAGEAGDAVATKRVAILGGGAISHKRCRLKGCARRSDVCWMTETQATPTAPGCLLRLLALCVALLVASAATASAICEKEGALRRASATGNAATVRALLASGVPTDSRECPSHPSALGIAGERGHLEIVRLLLAHGANRYSASMWTLAQRDDTAVVAAIMESAAPDERAALMSDALAAACRHGRLEVVRYLLAAGADPNAGLPRTGGEAPLPAAAKYPTLLALLLDAGAAPTAAALRAAAGSGSEESVRLLLAAGADPGYSDQAGNALSITAAKSAPSQSAAYDAIGALLLTRGVDPNQTHYGKSPLSWASENGNDALAQRLIEAGARGGTTTAYKLRRIKKSLQKVGYVVVLFLGGGH